MRGITALLLACSLCGPLYPQAAGAPVQPVGSLAERSCEANAPLLPGATLVKDVLAAMPDKCDERLFGTWYCGISCLYDDCEADHGVITLRRSIDPDGYERIHERHDIMGLTYLSEWKVERKWRADVSNNPPRKGKLVFSSCNGKTDAGYNRLAVNLKNPDGSDRYLYQFWVDGANRTMWLKTYKVHLVGDKVHKTIYRTSECRRELAP